LIPQVYLHYDPYTAARRGAPGPLSRQRMDFLLLLPHRARVVIECDGKQHYADASGRADPRRNAAMMAEDWELRLKRYEVYRFGGAELATSGPLSVCSARSSTVWTCATRVDPPLDQLLALFGGTGVHRPQAP
jgi:hypothetical protein